MTEMLLRGEYTIMHMVLSYRHRAIFIQNMV